MLKCFHSLKKYNFFQLFLGLQDYRTLKQVELSMVQTVFCKLCSMCTFLELGTGVILPKLNNSGLFTVLEKNMLMEFQVFLSEIFFKF